MGLDDRPSVKRGALAGDLVSWLNMVNHHQNLTNHAVTRAVAGFEADLVSWLNRFTNTLDCVLPGKIAYSGVLPPLFTACNAAYLP